MELVEVKKDKVYTDSLIYAEEMGLVHRNLMIKIRELSAKVQCSENYFKKEVFKNARGREYEKFLITRKGFMFLIMNTEAKGEKRQKLLYIQERFVEAFFNMESELVRIKTNQKNEEWIGLRRQGKNARVEMTDVVKNFVDYATNQGSKNAIRYYSNITKMENKALGLIVQNKIILRDLLDTMQLFQLVMAEDLVKRQLKKYMEKELHYKEIYLLIKQDVENFAKGLMIGN